MQTLGATKPINLRRFTHARNNSNKT